MPANKPPLFVSSALAIWKHKTIDYFHQSRAFVVWITNAREHTKKIVLIHKATITRCGFDSCSCLFKSLNRLHKIVGFPSLSPLGSKKQRNAIMNFYWSFSVYQTFIVSRSPLNHISRNFASRICRLQRFAWISRDKNSSKIGTEWLKWSERDSPSQFSDREGNPKLKTKSFLVVYSKRVCQFWLKLIIKFAIVSNPITLDSRLPVMTMKLPEILPSKKRCCKAATTAFWARENQIQTH